MPIWSSLFPVNFACPIFLLVFVTCFLISLIYKLFSVNAPLLILLTHGEFPGWRNFSAFLENFTWGWVAWLISVLYNFFFAEFATSKSTLYIVLWIRFKTWRGKQLIQSSLFWVFELSLSKMFSRKYLREKTSVWKEEEEEEFFVLYSCLIIRYNSLFLIP